jgi:hypothetical protein
MNDQQLLYNAVAGKLPTRMAGYLAVSTYLCIDEW